MREIIKREKMRRGCAAVYNKKIKIKAVFSQTFASCRHKILVKEKLNDPSWKFGTELF